MRKVGEQCGIFVRPVFAQGDPRCRVVASHEADIPGGGAERFRLQVDVRERNRRLQRVVGALPENGDFRLLQHRHAVAPDGPPGRGEGDGVGRAARNLEIVEHAHGLALKLGKAQADVALPGGAAAFPGARIGLQHDVDHVAALEEFGGVFARVAEGRARVARLAQHIQIRFVIRQREAEGALFRPFAGMTVDGDGAVADAPHRELERRRLAAHFLLAARLCGEERFRAHPDRAAAEAPDALQPAQFDDGAVVFAGDEAEAVFAVAAAHLLEDAAEMLVVERGFGEHFGRGRRFGVPEQADALIAEDAVDEQTVFGGHQIDAPEVGVEAEVQAAWKKADVYHAHEHAKDKNGKEKPTIFAVKHYVGKVAKGGKNKKDVEGNERDLNKNGKTSELKDQAYKRKLSEKERLEAEKKKLEEAQQQKEQQKTADKKEVKKDDKKGKKADGKNKGKDSPFSVPKIINPKKGTNFRAEKFGDASFNKKDVKVQEEKVEPFQKPIETKKTPIKKEQEKIEEKKSPWGEGFLLHPVNDYEPPQEYENTNNRGK